MKALTKALVGTVAAGAVAMGSAGAAQAQRYDYRYDRGYDRGYNGDPRQAVEQCTAAATAQADRYGGNARVTDVRDINRTRDGYVVKGRIAVNTRNRDWRGGWGNDWRGRNDRYRGYDAGKFSCRVSFGRVVDVHISGIRGL